ncbi:hypothetical protein [Murinocardiopsis flavida]|nr:hypothetical protein [Murinocardiopsis flavida]
MAKHLLINGPSGNILLPADTDTDAVLRELEDGALDGRIVTVNAEDQGDPSARFTVYLNLKNAVWWAIVER